MKQGFPFAMLISLCLTNAARAADPASRPATGAVHVENITYDGFSDAIKISNREAEAVIVPELGGRLMRFASVGGENVLWENPTAAQTPAGQWKNWGGEKNWPWPQSDWPARAGSGWPPPPAADQQPFEAKMEADGLTLTSKTLVGYDLRIVRHISMSADAAKLTEEATFEAAGANAGVKPVAAWSIVQVRVAPKIFARLTPEAVKKQAAPNPTPLFSKLGFADWPGVGQADAQTLVFTKPPLESKVGMEGTMLGAVEGNQLFSVEAVHFEPENSSAYSPWERLQVYYNATTQGPAGDPRGYYELEITGPKGTIGTQVVSLRTVLTLQSVTPAEASDPVLIAGKLKSEK